MGRIRISGIVAAHPRRLGVAQALKRSTPPGAFDLVLDPSPESPVSLRTAMLAWSSIPSTSTHHLVLEDDAVPTPGFIEHAEAAAAAAPNAAIAFYANWNSRNGGAIRMGTLIGARWAPAAAEYTPTVALMLPAEVGAGFAPYAREHGGTWPDDVVMSRYLTHVGVRTLLTVPSLVQHGDLPSLSGNDFHGLRMAACHARLPQGTDWKAIPVERMDAVPFFASGVAQCQLRYQPGNRFLSVDRGRFGPRVGLDAAACEAAFEEALRSIPQSARYLRNAVASKALLEFWYAGYVLGLLGRRANQNSDAASLVKEWMIDPLVRTSVSSLGPGGLCNSMTAAVLLKAQPFLSDLGLLALIAGAQAEPCPSVGGGTRGNARVRKVDVAVGPTEQPLAGVLACDLRDRGHRAAAASEPAAGVELMSTKAADTIIYVTPLPPPDISITDDCRCQMVVNDAWTMGIRRAILLDPTGRWAGCSATENPTDRDDLTVTRLYLGVPYGPELGAYSQVNRLVHQALRRQPMTPQRGRAFPLIHAWDVAALVDQLLSMDELAPTAGEARKPGGVATVTPQRLTEVIREMVHPVAVAFLEPADEPGFSVEANPQAADPELPARSAPMLAPIAGLASLDWTPSVSLSAGIRTVSQWLAYEAGPAQVATRPGPEELLRAVDS